MQDLGLGCNMMKKKFKEDLYIMNLYIISWFRLNFRGAMGARKPDWRYYREIKILVNEAPEQNKDNGNGKKIKQKEVSKQKLSSIREK